MPTDRSFIWLADAQWLSFSNETTGLVGGGGYGATEVHSLDTPEAQSLYKTTKPSDLPPMHPHWNAVEGLETRDVWVYCSAAEEVELLVNGESLGIVPMPPCGHAEFDHVNFTAGKIVAVAFPNRSTGSRL